MKSSHKQTGSAHAVGIVIVVLALLGVVGFVFWNNFIKSPPANIQTITNTNIKTFNSKLYDISFQYPTNFTVSEDDSGVQNGLHVIGIDIKDEYGKTVATIGTDFEGGSTCINSDDPNAPNPSNNVTVIGSQKLNIAGIDAVYYSATILQASDTEYNLGYGLSWNTQTDGTSPVDCASVQLQGNTHLSAPSTEYGNLSFHSADESYSTLESAKAFLQTDQYKKIESMIKSLKITKA